ncbi:MULTISPECIES: DUF72 domain-containing protein [Enterococcus]|uniref:DUF72 domain-containing protein n=1 Tax=Candidatus Enterococcus ferrettii TaxID=2815324 RepID=A0ABV0EHS4_9ENTE|nr:DUF72 domain-containing protein [Enterococcus sp. 665A]MBO1338530.1 DUF72 domain-containing protein [Enterococcus sp. 665A]
MIRIGLTSFNEHQTLTGKPRTTLFEYAGFLPLVELDTAYYGLPSRKTVENWLSQVPDSFRFVVKFYSGFTCQEKWQDHYGSIDEMQQHFLEVMSPLIESSKLYCFLAQFPAQFKCTKENIAYLQTLRQLFPDLPIAVELRDYSWYSPEFKEKTYQFMKKLNFSLTMVDEPELPDTIPLDLTVTNTAFSLFRFHGRNQAYWKSRDPQWRKKRTLYRYSEAELSELADAVRKVADHSEQVAVIFNNNSGGDAAENALRLRELLDIQDEGLNPSQLGLF